MSITKYYSLLIKMKLNVNVYFAKSIQFQNDQLCV